MAMKLSADMLREMKEKQSSSALTESAAGSPPPRLGAAEGKAYPSSSCDLRRAEDHGKQEPPSASGTQSGLATKKVMKQGWLIKQGGASGSLFSRETWKRRWAVLEPSRLSWADTPTSLPKGEVYLKGATGAQQRRSNSRRA
jgi:hypothetical protein